MGDREEKWWGILLKFYEGIGKQETVRIPLFLMAASLGPSSWRHLNAPAGDRKASFLCRKQTGNKIDNYFTAKLLFVNLSNLRMERINE